MIVVFGPLFLVALVMISLALICAGTPAERWSVIEDEDGYLWLVEETDD